MKKFSLIIVLPLLIAGCASFSTKQLSINCQALDWQTLGEKDGKIGRYPYEISQYQKACPTVQLTQSVRESWELGRQIGLKSYCTKSFAYELGQRGYRLNQVCPEEGLLEIQQSHALGFEQYYQRTKLQQMLYHPATSPWLYDIRDPFYW